MIHKPPATGIPFLNAALRWAYRTMKANSIMMPAEGWTQTPDGLMPPPLTVFSPSLYLFPFKLTRASQVGNPGVTIRYGVVRINGADNVPTIDETAVPLTSTTTDNFLDADPAGGSISIYLETEFDDSDEWTPSVVTPPKIKAGTLPSNSGGGTANCMVYFPIGTVTDLQVTNNYFTNLAIIRFGQAASDYTIYTV